MNISNIISEDFSGCVMVSNSDNTIKKSGFRINVTALQCLFKFEATSTPFCAKKTTSTNFTCNVA